MSDIIKSENNNGKVTPSGRGTRGRGKKDPDTVNDRAPVTIDVQNIHADDQNTVADLTLADAAVTLADAELKAGIEAYDKRSNQNLGLFGQFVKEKQSRTANAISQHALETFGVTEQALYGTPTNS